MNANSISRSAHVAEPASAHAIVVNGEGFKTSARTLSDLLVELGYGEAKVATAINGDFVPARVRDQTPVRSGDKIEVVAPRQGG